MEKLVIFAFFITYSTIQGARLTSSRTNTEIIPMEKEERILAGTIPIVGSLSLIGLNLLWNLISAAWSLIGYKLTAISMIADGAYWVFNHCLPVLLIGGALMLGVYKLTGFSSLAFMDEDMQDVNQTLIIAARSLEQGALKYGSL